MRVLMLGWDFSPRLSGGVGSACQGLANALARLTEPLATEVLFVLPRLRGDEEPERVTLIANEGPRLAPRAWTDVAAQEEKEPEAERPAAATRSTPAPEREPEEDTALVLFEEPAPAPLATPAEALRLLTIDSPLRPYLSPEDYSEVVRALLARIAPPPVRRRVVRVPLAHRTRVAPAQRAPTPIAKTIVARAAAPAAPAREPEPVAVPPYGRTLLAEVERYARAALARVQNEAFDVIHAHDWMTFPAALLLKERTGKPLVVHFHSCEAERRGPTASRDVRAVEQAALDAAERVLCVSEASARTLRAHYALEFAKLRVLHNAYAPLPETGAPDGARAPTVLYLGRLSEQKSPDVFLRAAARVHAHLPDVRFVLAGEGELYPELVRLATELGLDQHVTFTGFVSGEELARTYAGADVYVLSSSSEPFGISALEALSLGVPTVVPRGAGVTEVVRSVLRFDPADEGELADKVVALLAHPALRRQLSAAGLREVRKLRWDRPARALRGIYGELAGAP
jgi:glycosyltransferase involved in cell wall biosynthesis